MRKSQSKADNERWAIAKSNQAKRIMRDHLQDHNPEMLACFAEVGKVFGRMESVGYSGPTSPELRARMLTIIADELRKAKEVLK